MTTATLQALILSVCIQLTGATLFGFIIAATRRIVQFIAPIQKVTTTNLQVSQPLFPYSLCRRIAKGCVCVRVADLSLGRGDNRSPATSTLCGSNTGPYAFGFRGA